MRMYLNSLDSLSICTATTLLMLLMRITVGFFFRSVELLYFHERICLSIHDEPSLRHPFFHLVLGMSLNYSQT